MANNVKNLQNALKWLKHRIREEVKLDGCTSVDHAAELEFIQNVLKKFPLRQCDVGTAEEQCARWRKFCDSHTERISDTSFVCNCPCKGCGIGECELEWAQMPYEQEGGAK